MQASTVLFRSPSFNSYSSFDRCTEIGDNVSEESKSPVSGNETGVQSSNQQSQIQQNESDDDDFEFVLVSRDPDDSPISADDIFSNGQIRPIFPIFNRDLLLADGHDDFKPPKVSSLRLPLRKLFLEERDPPSSSSSEADELDGVPPGTYCVWTPKSVEASPGRCKKSNSTGSSRWWRFRDLLHRSNSDGKDAFVFLSPSSETSTKTNKREEKAEKAEVSKERRNSSETNVAGKVKAKGIAGETISAHEIHYVRNRALKEGVKRRSYLPYRQELVGLFGNGNGLSRNLHPPF
ncbi:hypothetical protein HHK36_015579 [Tetracentron sinense]|uniref:Uncharacterized protein n=1 Tax=Tetracentron sinense TaxID=13715 RepID=A0A835DGW9_TETSI|nr:hypothetical protein HHK36_015579 [Tetracentron sinense]